MKTLAPLLLAAALLSGCAAMRSVTSDVASYGEWPAQRAPGTFAFERLPSQNATPEVAAAMTRLEHAAQAALVGKGFRPAATGQEPDVLVQVGQRVNRQDPGPWADPLWWRGGFGSWRYGPWVRPSWALHARLEPPRFETEVAMLLRDRASGKPLYETRASSDGNGSESPEMLAAMFQAALMDFPQTGLNPRRVTITPPAAP